LWQLSLAVHAASGPLPVLRWSPTLRRRIEKIRDGIMRGVGTEEPLFEEILPDEVALREFGKTAISVSWRKPLRIDEVNQLVPTEEVRQRPGRA
jgi:hypothetical protein